MEENHWAQQLWNSLVRSPIRKTSCEEREVELGIDTQNQRQSRAMAAESTYIDFPHHQGMASSSNTVHRSPPGSYTQPHISIGNGQAYAPFVKATKEGNWDAMEKFLHSHPEAARARSFRDKSTALHYTLHMGKDREKIAACLVEFMEPDDLKIEDEKGFTPLAIAALHHHPIRLLSSMVRKNPNLPNIGEVHTIPVAVACWKGFKDTTRFLYQFTDRTILSPEHEDGLVGVYLLHHCINIKLFDIASDLVEKIPNILFEPYIEVKDEDENKDKGKDEDEDENKDKRKDENAIYPIHAFAKTISAFPIGGWNQKIPNFAHHIRKYVYCFLEGSEEENEVPNVEESIEIAQARVFLELVCKHLSKFGINELRIVVDEAMIEAAKNGNMEFITAMLKVNSELILAEKNGKNMFWHAVVNRREKVFNLIYDLGDHKDSLLSHVNKHNNNILHCAAKLPRSSILDRISSPALQMQRELQWFKEVSNVAKTRYRGNVNKFKLTPSQLFTKQHSDLLDAAETSMKDTAKAATTVGALIITTMFAAAFTVTGGNNKVTTNSSILNDMMLDTFVVCDALSLCSSTSAILVFLGILTSRYSEQDFLVRLPRRFMIGFYTLFAAIATMMVSFCCALAITLQGRPQVMVLLVCVLIFVPIMFGLSSMCPLLRETHRSTCGPSIFDKSTKLPKSGRGSLGGCY